MDEEGLQPSSYNTLEELIYASLDNALDYGIREIDFWDMTLAEISREVKSKERIRKIEMQERASYDYIQAGLIGKYISVILDGKGSIPAIEEAYPGVFDDLIKQQQEERERKKAELSALRFRQFAQSYNNSFKNKEVPT